MARTQSDYGLELRQLLPSGKVWPRDATTKLGAVTDGLGAEFSRLEQRGLDLIEEAYPDTTNEMLPDWERVAGLPDPAIPAPTAYDDRIAALLDRLVSRGDISPAGFVAIAARFGFTATVAYNAPFYADISHADEPLNPADVVFWWEMNVTVPEDTPTPLVALEHAVRTRMPAHTYVTFNYSNDPIPDFDYDFTSG
jgi:uncharacterized protein YmfQ (DUF2313 family)